MLEKQKIVRVFISESGRWKGIPLFRAIIELCRNKGIKGATVIKGIEGYGLHNKLHTGSILRLSGDLPLIVEIVDSKENVENILPDVDKMMTGGLITMEDIEVFSQGYIGDGGDDNG